VVGFGVLTKDRAISSAGERHLDKVEADGSNPSSPMLYPTEKETMPNTTLKPSSYETLGKMIDSVLDNGDIVPIHEARRIAEEMHIDHPDEWYEFLESEGYRLVYGQLRSGLASRRNRARHQERVAGETTPAGQPKAPIFQDWHCRVDEENTQRPLGEMTGPNHQFVANEHRKNKNEARMLEAFHRALAKKCGDLKTSEVMDEEALAKLYRSFISS
jgi:hypothetical protein